MLILAEFWIYYATEPNQTELERKTFPSSDNVFRLFFYFSFLRYILCARRASVCTHFAFNDGARLSAHQTPKRHVHLMHVNAVVIWWLVQSSLPLYDVCDGHAYYILHNVCRDTIHFT